MFSWIIRLKSLTHSLLRKSERYTKTDMVYLAGGGFWFGLGQIITSLSTLAIAVAFANLVSPTTYGTYKYILSLAGIFSLFSLPGLHTAVTRAVARGEEGVFLRATKARVLSGLLGSVVSFIGGLYYFLNENITLALALWIISATLPFFDTLTLYLARVVGMRRFDLHAGYRIVEYLISATSIIATLFFTDNVLYILLAYFVPLVCVRAFFFFRTLPSISKTIEKDVLGDVLRYGKHLTAIQVLGVISMQIDKVLLWKLLGPGAVAVYAFAIAVPDQMRGPIKGIGELAFSKFAQKDSAEISQSIPALWRKLTLYGLGLFLIALLYALIAPMLYQFLFPQYLESVRYSQIVAFSLIAGVGTLAFRLFEAQKKTKAQYGISITQHLVQILLFVTLIPLYGIMGAVVALLLGSIFMIIQTIFFTQKIFTNKK